MKVSDKSKYDDDQESEGSPSQSSQEEQFRYFSLVQNVGTKGRYQYTLFIITMVYFFLNSLTSNNAAFIFMNPEFDCYGQEILTQNCEKYVCQNYSQDQIKEFPRIVKYETIATQFGPYYCSDNYKLGIFRGVQSIGAFFGIALGITFSDNKSRKYAFVICCSLCCIGLLMLTFSSNIYMACISLFIVGLGDNVCLRISQVLISEQTQKHLSNKFLSVTLFPFAIGALILGQIFAITKEWRSFTFYFCFLPFLIVTLFVIIAVQDSPKYLLKRPQEHAVKALNKIAFINGSDFRYKEGDLTEYIKNQGQYEQIQHKVTPFDIFYYKSLRMPSVHFCIIFFALDFFFYSYNAMINKVGFGEVVNGYLFGMGAITGLTLSFLLANIAPRRILGTVSYLIMSILYFTLIFLKVSDKCYDCTERYIQMIALIVANICLYLMTSMLYLHFFEFYPVSIRNIGSGIPTLCGAIGIFCSQFFIVGAFQVSLTLPFILMALMAFIASLNYAMTPETLNKVAEDQIEQIYLQHKMGKQQECEKAE